jgi:hypothetical protein
MVMEEHIRSIPAMLRQTHERVEASRDILAPLLDGPLVILGCGSSRCVAQAAAALYEQQRLAPAQAIVPSDYVPRRDWMHSAISRTGQTTEVIEALQRIRKAGARSLLLSGAPASQAARYGRQPYAAKKFFERYARRITFGLDVTPPTAEEYAPYFRFLETSDEYFNYAATTIPGQGRWHIYGIHLDDEALYEIYAGTAQRVIVEHQSPTARISESVVQ